MFVVAQTKYGIHQDHRKTYNNNKAMKYFGVIVMIIGAIFLMLIAFANFLPQSNGALAGGLAIVVIGYILHIFLDKRAEGKVRKND